MYIMQYPSSSLYVLFAFDTWSCCSHLDIMKGDFSTLLVKIFQLYVTVHPAKTGLNKNQILLVHVIKWDSSVQNSKILALELCQSASQSPNLDILNRNAIEILGLKNTITKFNTIDGSNNRLDPANSRINEARRQVNIKYTY